MNIESTKLLSSLKERKKHENRKKAIRRTLESCEAIAAKTLAQDDGEEDLRPDEPGMVKTESESGQGYWDVKETRTLEVRGDPSRASREDIDKLLVKQVSSANNRIEYVTKYEVDRKDDTQIFTYRQERPAAKWGAQIGAFVAGGFASGLVVGQLAESTGAFPMVGALGALAVTKAFAPGVTDDWRVAVDLKSGKAELQERTLARAAPYAIGAGAVLTAQLCGQPVLGLGIGVATLLVGAVMD